MLFILPHPTMSSGGHSYNRKVLEPNLLPLEPVYAEPGVPLGELGEGMPGEGDGWILWDSLLMDRMVEAASLRTPRRCALLVHYLPSRDPLLATAARTALRSREDSAARCAEAFIATGLGMGRELRLRYPGTPIFVCEPGIDPAFRAARAHPARLPQPSCLNLVTVANLVPSKGHARILAILQHLQDLEWRWHLVGDANADPSFTRDWLEEVAHSGLGERIHLTGSLSQDELVTFLGGMDIFVSASHLESYGMALAEAVATGLPALTTRVGEADRLVRDGVQGFVVDFGAWGHFQDLLRRMLEDPALRQRMAQAPPSEPTRTWQATREELAAACRAILALPLSGSRSIRN